MMIQVKSFYAHNELRNFSYLIFDPTSGDAYVIDPFEAQPLIDYIKKEGLYLKGILNTHQHWDHIRGNPLLQSTFKCQICQCKDGETIKLAGGHSLKTLGTPGHTHDHHAFLWNGPSSSQAIFSGDTLFNSGVGNCKNGGNVMALFQTTLGLAKLPDETVLYPGHDYMVRNLQFAQHCEPENKDIKEALIFIQNIPTEENLGWTLAQEKKVNPFLRLESEEIRQNILGIRNDLDQPLGLERDLFVKLRFLRDQW